MRWHCSGCRRGVASRWPSGVVASGRSRGSSQPRWAASANVASSRSSSRRWGAMVVRPPRGRSRCLPGWASPKMRWGVRSWRRWPLSTSRMQDRRGKPPRSMQLPRPPMRSSASIASSRIRASAGRSRVDSRKCWWWAWATSRGPRSSISRPSGGLHAAPARDRKDAARIAARHRRHRHPGGPV
jgi:hypothetical protein